MLKIILHGTFHFRDANGRRLLIHFSPVKVCIESTSVNVARRSPTSASSSTPSPECATYSIPATPSSASATLLTTLQEKEDLYIINMDNMDNTHTSLQEHPRYYFRKIHPSQSIFLPRCDAMICHISSSNHTSLESMRMLLSAHDFSTQYSIPLTTHTDREEEENSCIIPLMKQLFPQHQHTDTHT